MPKPRKETPHPTTGRPARPFPEPIPDTPEQVANALLTTPPKATTDWKFLRRKDRKPS